MNQTKMIRASNSFAKFQLTATEKLGQLPVDRPKSVEGSAPLILTDLPEPQQTMHEVQIFTFSVHGFAFNAFKM